MPDFSRQLHQPIEPDEVKLLIVLIYRDQTPSSFTALTVTVPRQRIKRAPANDRWLEDLRALRCNDMRSV